MGARKRDKLKRITSSWAGRTLATGRAAAKMGAAAASRGRLGTSLAEELDSMKGLAMKVGQMASYLEGSLPPEAQRTLRKLQQSGDPLDLETLRPVVEERALGGTLEDLFDHFEAQPLASASIAQVHRAVFEGRPVAVKVQYPHIASTFDIDLGHLRRLGVLAGLGSAFDANEIVAELRERLLEECDFEAEARHQSHFREVWRGTDWVHIPEVVAPLSGATVLTTALADGHRFYDFRRGSHQAERNLAGQRIFSFAFGSIFGHRVLHGDPHPGNYLFTEDRVVFLDFGCVRTYDRTFVDNWKRLAWTVLDGRRQDMPEAMVATGMVPRADKYDFDYHWDVMRYLYEPFLASRFRYTHDYVQRSWNMLGLDNPNVRRTRMPPEWVLTNRLQWGLNSVLALLDAEGDFGALYREALGDRPDA